MPYVAPVKDMLFVMNELAGLSTVVSYPTYAEAGADVDLASAILEESAKFNQDVVAPLNWSGDQNPSSLKDGVVTTTPGFKEAFAQFGAAGWQGVVHPAEFGGQGLPKLIATACFEMVHSASCLLYTSDAADEMD
jgi:alkylation response protein AidB-like acyl-CoA dehydrogenase